MDLGIEGEVGVRQPESGGTAGCVGDSPGPGFGKLCSSSSSSAGYRIVKDIMRWM
jgi:hypothetical protein